MSERKVLVGDKMLVRATVETGFGAGVGRLYLSADTNDPYSEDAHPHIDLRALARDLDCEVGDIPAAVESLVKLRRAVSEDEDRQLMILADLQAKAEEAGYDTIEEAVESAYDTTVAEGLRDEAEADQVELERQLRALEAACEEAGVECSPEGIKEGLRRAYLRGPACATLRATQERDEARAEAQRWRERAEKAEEALEAVKEDPKSYAMDEAFEAHCETIREQDAEIDRLRAEVDRLREECGALWVVLAANGVHPDKPETAQKGLIRKAVAMQEERRARESKDSGVTVTGSPGATGPAQMPHPQEVREWEERTGRKFDIGEGTPSETEDSGRSRAVEPADLSSGATEAGREDPASAHPPDPDPVAILHAANILVTADAHLSLAAWRPGEFTDRWRETAKSISDSIRKWLAHNGVTVHECRDDDMEPYLDPEPRFEVGEEREPDGETEHGAAVYIDGRTEFGVIGMTESAEIVFAVDDDLLPEIERRLRAEAEGTRQRLLDTIEGWKREQGQPAGDDDE